MITRLNLWLTISSLTIVAAILIIVFIKPLWGVDFTGGSLLEFKTTLSSDALTQTVTTTGLSATVQNTGDQSYLVRTSPLNPEQHEKIVAELKNVDGTIEELRFESIGPTIGEELRRKAGISILLSIVVMIGYLAYEFRHTGGLISSWKYGVAATVALVHDVLVVTACFVILGRLYGITIDALYVSAMLALFGFSVNDTIVFFNRLKQEWLATRTGDLVSVMDRAAKLVIMRSLNTAITIFLTLLTLFFFGGATIHWFVLSLLIGTVVGTYSTLFVAPPFLYLLSRR